MLELHDYDGHRKRFTAGEMSQSDSQNQVLSIFFQAYLIGVGVAWIRWPTEKLYFMKKFRSGSENRSILSNDRWCYRFTFRPNWSGSKLRDFVGRRTRFKEDGAFRSGSPYQSTLSIFEWCALSDLTDRGWELCWPTKALHSRQQMGVSIRHSVSIDIVNFLSVVPSVFS